MKKRMLLSFTVIFLFTFVFSISANAYTYGDPNEEELAEVYKEMVLN